MPITRCCTGCGVKENSIPDLASHNKRPAIMISRVVHWIRVDPSPPEGCLGSSVCLSLFESEPWLSKSRDSSQHRPDIQQWKVCSTSKRMEHQTSSSLLLDPSNHQCTRVISLCNPLAPLRSSSSLPFRASQWSHLHPSRLLRYSATTTWNVLLLLWRWILGGKQLQEGKTRHSPCGTERVVLLRLWLTQLH